MIVKSELRSVLVGCGRIAQRHAEVLCTNKVPGAQLVAVCDTDGAKARDLAERFKVAAYDDMHVMMAKEKPDLVAILTESGNHPKHIIELAPYKAHIIVEKPMALSLDAADAAIRACDLNKVKLFVVKQNRFNPAVKALKERIDRGRFGKLVMGTVRVRWCRTQAYYDEASWRGTWAFDGGVLANQASHHLDLLEWMMGDVESVFARTNTSLVEIEAEDTAVAVLKFRNGALGVVEATTATRPKDLEGSLSVLGERGAVEIAGFAVNAVRHWNFVDPLPEDLDAAQRYSVDPKSVYGFGHHAYYEHVVDCIMHNKQQLIDGIEGRRSLELISAIYESVETGEEVRLRFSPKRCRLGAAA
jgi:predicted dehydrogenase